MISARPAVAVALACVLACASRETAAAPWSRTVPVSDRDTLAALSRLDPDAAVWLRIDAPALAALTTELERRLTWRPGTLVGIIRLAAEPLAPLLSVDGWTSLGLDPTRPAVGSLAALDERTLLDAAGISGALFPRLPVPAATGPRGAPLWRSRVVFTLADPTRARTALAALAGAIPVDDAHAGDIAALLPGATPSMLATATAVARGPRGAVVVARLDDRFLIVDAFAAVRGSPDPAQIARLLTRKGGFVPRTDVDAHLGSSGLSIVVDPVRATTALLWIDLLATRPSPTRADILALRTRCDATVAVTARGALGRAAATLRAAPGHITAALTWLVDGRLGKVLANTRDAHLPRPTAVDASLSSYVASWAPLTSLPGDGFTIDLPPHLEACRSSLAAMVTAYGWPHQIGALYRNLGRAEPSVVPALLAALGPAVAVLHRAPGEAPARASVEVAIAAAHADELAALADDVWGSSRGAVVRRWGTGPLRAFARTFDGASTAGLAIGGGTDPHLALAAGAPVAPGTVFELRAARRALASLYPLAGSLGELAVVGHWDGALRIDVDLAAP